MSARRQFLKAVAASFASGALAAAIVNAAWWLTTGTLPSVLTTLIAAEIVTSLWGGAQALRFRRKWQRVLDSYHRPALGEGIDTPHRPPADEQDGGTR